MAQESKTQDTTVEKVDINIDELFAAAPDADAIVTPETKPKNIFSKKERADLDFIDKKEEKAEEPEPEAKTENSDAEIDKYSAGVQKRIDQLTKQYRDEERARQEAQSIQELSLIHI